jgi:hypothetical protein
MKKYFAYDALEREFTTHETLEEAKSQAQDYVDQTFDFGADDGFSDDLEDGIKETCFGVVLGGFDLPTRPLTKEEEDIYGDQYTHMVENPVFFEYPRNGWIKCSDAHPGDDRYVICFLPDKNNPENWDIFCASYDTEMDVWFTENDVVYKRGTITHWKELPQPPSE